ncbi:2-hydroxy-6-oxononadienedioate/2-hydroxy-6- oxononatrienedioate hydrolase [Colletotrichum scovillei]|uniref:2-hydroxy-6-oxononadienedioate/2-hydroxy-6-oxononatrienedioate hydrolase n=1 Tax=Colletotrichum scovillei TaxID=1209932 RepID=A0A9P7QUN3_9PEZI|nr:2-hydroxy-6-oxononadienedioate/2-hydroxy-6- oxononatrienedioate hydrolase [Colletotrichum scovillei]KAG7041433.1 2-hydroxy-6-oxononadienedioate/2-hydroxy-6- oxononatrienedioate hydrolase [Colletotrichum scovillei]KAG7061460.1 2-hydroxy-6-oxononadienedioate/2-hydroxy-6- oxononatrienedioate hydrolase [Colletotrichum scovillei]
MSQYENAPNQSILVKGSKMAYRWLGPKHGIPVIHLVSFRATMSQIDPVSVNKIAEKRPVILFDNAGVGRSEGQVPTSYAGWADYCAELIVQLGFNQVDVLAFSMGGCAAQMMALNYPALVRRLILIGSLPSIGPGVILPPPAPFQGIRMAHDHESQEAALLEFCFHSSDASQAAGRATFRRMLEARDDWSDLIDADSTRRQVQAFARFMNPQRSSEGSFRRFNELRIPILIIRGSHDYVFERQTCQAMARQMYNATVSVYEFPDAGHAPHWQYPEEFAELVDSFLCTEDTMTAQELPENWVRWIHGSDLISKI